MVYNTNLNLAPLIWHPGRLATLTISPDSEFPLSSVRWVAQSCPTLCDPMNHSTPGPPVHHQLPEFTHSRPSSQWCHPAISSSVVPFSSCPQSLPASESFPMSQLFTWGGQQSTGVSALAWVVPNLQCSKKKKKPNLEIHQYVSLHTAIKRIKHYYSISKSYSTIIKIK